MTAICVPDRTKRESMKRFLMPAGALAAVTSRPESGLLPPAFDIPNRLKASPATRIRTRVKNSWLRVRRAAALAQLREDSAECRSATAKEIVMPRKFRLVCLFLLLGLLSLATQPGFAQNPPPLGFSNNFFVTGDYIVAGAYNM